MSGVFFDMRFIKSAWLFFVAVCAYTSLAALEIESGESAPEMRAAAELKKYIALLAEEEPDLKVRIGVKYLALFPEDKVLLGDWYGYAVRRRDGYIYIVSPQPRGCLYGVYDFLERNSDIIWARPDEECGTICSRTKNFTVGEADFIERPVFQLRGWWFCGPSRHEASEYWHSRVRCNFGCANQKRSDVLKRALECGFSVGGAAGHNMPEFMPGNVFDLHPEYFAEIGGERRRDRGNTQLCYSNLDGAALVGSNAVAKIAKRYAELKASHDAVFDHWAVKQADNLRLCECAACQADIPLGEGRFSRKGDANFRSNQFFRYLNKVEDVIAATYPKLRVDTFAYQFSAPPPDVKINDMYNVAFCPFIKNDRFSVTNAVNAKWAARAEKWSKATKNIMWREYWGCASGYPRQHSLVAVNDLRWINSSLGFTRVYSETMPDVDTRGKKGKGYDYRLRWDASAMEHWVLSRLMWNPYVPVERYREEYIRRTYRKAAAPMREFYALLAKTWFSDARPTNYTDDPVGNASRYIVEAKIAKRILELLDEAKHLAQDDVPALVKLIDRQKTHFESLIKNCVKPPDPLLVPFVADGDWAKAAVIDGFFRVNRDKMKKKQRSRRRTKVYVCHDAKELKVKFVCEDPDPSRFAPTNPGEVASEKFPGGDHVEMVVTTKKGSDGYHFGVDCRGVRADMKNGNIDFNAKWTSRAIVTAKGYEVEMAINLESIGAEITRENRFGVCFARMSLPRTPYEKREFSSWKGDHPQAMLPTGSIFINVEQ
jgi:hypothetical protein